LGKREKKKVWKHMKVFVTLITNEAYLSGALVLAHSLKVKYSSKYPVFVLCPPNTLSKGTISMLYRAFDRVKYVPLLRSGNAPSDAQNLALLGRSDLDISFTKIHVFDPTVMGPEVDEFVFLVCRYYLHFLPSLSLSLLSLTILSLISLFLS
jgi:hypothetical protein